MTHQPITVSVVIPTLNEANDIAGCLEAIAAQSWPSQDLEVVIADGESVDGTADIARAAADALGLALRVAPNPARRTSCGLNVALSESNGRVIVRVDARSRIRPNHVSKAVEVLDERPDVGVVGGGQRTVARSGRLVDRAIARALSNRYTTGLAKYRRASRPTAADTVWMGSFRRSELVELDGWDEAIALNEDWDLNERYRSAGYVVWFDPAMDADYLPRPSFAKLARQYYRFGRVKGTWWARGRRPAPRQVVLVVAPVVGLFAVVVGSATIGPLPILASMLLCAIALDTLGAQERAQAQVRVGALSATAVSCFAWWVGVVVGACGEMAGIRHDWT